MDEPNGRDWLRMTPESFGHDAAPQTAVDAAAVPAVPDACGTPPLFGEERPRTRPAGGGRRTAGQRARQETLF
ncbi:hypothetical protein ACGFS9_19470 [Streptomyces sp. NPDC048566]|uniref:hypothetical protein n=1 Tax=Streptomyces sp. NPDC048566 TaxID=3365569 RepID=UPI00371D3B2A